MWLLLVLIADVTTAGQYCGLPDCGAQRDAARYRLELDVDLEAGPAGAKLAQAGRLEDALARFRAATVWQPFQPEAWTLVGRCLAGIAHSSLKRSASANLKHEDEQVIRELLREALAAYDVAMLLGIDTPSVHKKREKVLALFEHAFGIPCVGEEAVQCKQRDWDLRVLNHSQTQAALLCTSQEDVTVGLSANEISDGMLGAQTVRRMLAIFKLCGVLLLKGAFDHSLVDRIVAQQAVEFASHAEENPDAHHASTVKKTCGDQSVRRFELDFPLRPPFTDLHFLANRFVQEFIKLQLGDEAEADRFSHVTTLPGATAQPFSSADQLFKKSVVPPHSVVMVVPLNDLTPRNGPIEFECGSHHPSALQVVDSGRERTDQQLRRLTVLASRGDVLLYDSRLQTRETTNWSEKSRALAYVAYVRPWFGEVGNQHTSNFDALGNPVAKRSQCTHT